MPIDINELRDYKGGDPAKWRKYMEQRFKPPEWVDEVIAEDEKWRTMTQERDDLRKQVNTIQKEKITPKKKAKEDCTAEVAEMKAIQAVIKDLEIQIPELIAKRDKLLIRIGNMVDPEVPISEDEEMDNLVINLHPTPPEGADILPCSQGTIQYTLPATKPLTHDVLLWRIEGYEPERGQHVAGHRAYFLTNAGVFVNQAIINYGIAFLAARGYNVLQPPFFMNKDVIWPALRSWMILTNNSTKSLVRPMIQMEVPESI
jgi:seryl-tRNA synthetase